MIRVARALAIRPGEGRLIALVATAFAAVEAGRGLGEVGVYTLVLSREGSSVLPGLFIALGSVGVVATLGYGLALAHAPRERLFPTLLVALATVLLVERLAAMSGAGEVYFAMWVTVLAAGALLTTALWTVAGSVFHARQAKRLFPLCTSAAIAGSFIGLLAAGPLARVLGTETLVTADAVLMLSGAAALTRLSPRLRQPRSSARMRTPSTSLRAGAEYVARSPLMRLVAAAYLLFAVLLFSIEFPFQRAMRAAFTDEADFAVALGSLAAAITAASFLLSTLVANRLYARLGVATVAVLLPLVYLLGFGLWMVSFSLATAVAVRFAQQVSQRGLSNAAWTSFFNVVPRIRRGQVLAFMDGIPGQLGTIISGVLLLLAAALAPDQVFILGGITAALCLGVVIRIRQLYASSLVATLREGLAEQVLEGGPGIAALGRDPRVVTDLRAAARAPRPAQRRLAAELLGQLGAREAVADVAALLADEDEVVRRTAVEALARIGGDDAMAAVARAWSDASPAVRQAAIRVASTRPTGVPRSLDATVIRRLRDDPDPGVRAEVAIALCTAGRPDEGRPIIDTMASSTDRAERIAGLDAIARLRGPVPEAIVWNALEDAAPAIRAAGVRALDGLAGSDADGPFTARLVDALDDDDAEVRRTAAIVLARLPDVVPGVLTLLASGSERAQDAALSALEGKGELVRGPLVAWAVGQVNRASRLRRWALDLGPSGDGAPDVAPDRARGPDPAAAAAFLGFLLRRRGASIETRLLRAFALLDAPEASGLIRRCLHSNDPETRAQAIEALDALGDGELARAVVGLLDTEPEATSPSARQVVSVASVLTGDPDAWVRALAVRTLAAELDTRRRELVERASHDPDPVVRSAAPEMPPSGGSDMPDSRPTLGEIDRMLLLRRVPLFAMLAPEDLQRLAATAIERTYAGGEALVREGELGDELVVLVEGSVRVLRNEDGADRLVSRIDAGNHIGELAVLREAPRAATVVAEEPGVRGLVIGGAGLTSILRERPDAAMALLATLADRLSTQ